MLSVNTQLLPVVPIPLGDLARSHAKLISDSDFRCEIPIGVPLEVD